MASLDTLVTRMSSLEDRLEEHSQKLEDRLDRIVDLMQRVSSLQEKESTNSSAINELKKGIHEIVADNRSSIERIHQKLDIIVTDYKSSETRFKQKCDDIEDDLKDKIGMVKAEQEKWKNRGIGTWVGASLLWILIQTIGGIVLYAGLEEIKDMRNTISILKEDTALCKNLITPSKNDP